MTIKSKILPQTNVSADFPKLMISEINKMIVLFASEDCGTIIDLGTACEHEHVGVGAYHSNFMGRNFDDFKGTLELSNV